MRNLKLLLATTAFLFILATSCKKDIKTEPQATNIENAYDAKAALKQKLQKLKASLPANAKNRINHDLAVLSKLDPEFRDMVKRAMKVIEPTACDDNTKINQYLDAQLSDWDDNVIFYALVTGMLDFPTYDALLFENSSANQYYGLNGEFTHILEKTFKDIKRFWNINSNGMVLAAMHGNMLLNRDKIIRIDRILYGDDQATAEFYADLIIELMKEVPQYRKGDHPIFTFNAFSQSSFNFPPYGVIPNKIVMGDGILEAYKAIGFADVAPQAILAHEYGHQVQFQLGLYGNQSTPESTRQNELMADALSAYYLSHARGATMQWKRVQQFLQVFFNIGDCSFSSTGHHGTPTQRMAAAQFGYKVADDAQKQGHILTAQQFVALFQKALPNILAQ